MIKIAELDFLVPSYQFDKNLEQAHFGGVPTVLFSLNFHNISSQWLDSSFNEKD